MIRFNVPPFTGREMEYVKEAVDNMHICGDGIFTRKCSEYLEKITGTAKCLLTTSCTHALEMAALLCDFKEGMRSSFLPILLFLQRMLLCCGGEGCFCGHPSGHYEY